MSPYRGTGFAPAELRLLILPPWAEAPDPEALPGQWTVLRIPDAQAVFATKILYGVSFETFFGKESN